MPVFEDEERECVEFTDFWIFSYGDLVTLLLTFFILLFTFCKLDVEKFKSVAESFKPTPPGSPFFLEGQPSVLEQVAAQAETVEVPEELFVTLDDRGVVVSFKDSALFAPGSAQLLPKSVPAARSKSSKKKEPASVPAWPGSETLKSLVSLPTTTFTQ